MRTDIESLGLSKGVQNSFLAKLNAAVATKKSGVNSAAVGVYGAMKNEISAKIPDSITEDKATEIISCIDELITDLEAN